MNPAFSESIDNSKITIAIPSEVIAKTLRDILPLEFTGEGLSGAIRLESIQELEMKNNHVSFFADVRGKNLVYNATFGDHPLKLEFGDVDARCRIEASLRYQRKKQVLLVRPIITQSPEGEKADRFNLYLIPVLAIFNDREYPVEIQKLEPILARFSNKAVEIGMEISDVFIKGGTLFVQLDPHVKTRPR